MTITRGPRAVVVFLVILVGFDAHARADLPGAKDPKAYTQHTFAKEALEYNRQTMVQPYGEVGKRDVRWDAAAVAFLEAMAQHFSYSAVSEFYQPRELPSYAQCLAMGKAAIDQGCDDPLVLYCYARVQEWLQRPPSDFAGFYLRAREGMKRHGYPPMRAALAATRALDHAPAEQHRQLFVDRRAMLLKAAAGPFINRAQRRIVLWSLHDEFSVDHPIDGPQFVEDLKAAKDADPWIVNMYCGRYHIEAAWRARGSGSANTVTEQGWQGFAKHLEEAEKYLVAAWKLRPELADAPSLMITVAMGGGAKESGTAREWFERTVQAQFDYPEAYIRYSSSLMPRWGGSHEEMLELGLECARSGRYDTEVPYQLVKMLEAIRRDTGDWSLWRVPESYELATRVLGQYAERHKGRTFATRYASFHAALAWRLEKYEDARQVLDRLGGELDTKQFQELGGSRFAVPEVYARLGSHADGVAKATNLLQEGKPEEALALFRAIDAATSNGEKGKPYLKERVAIIDRDVRFAAGEWVDLLPSDDLLAGFTPTFGAWRVEDAPSGRRLVGSCEPGDRLLLHCDLDGGPRYEVSVTVDRVADASRRVDAQGLMFDYDPANRGHALVAVWDQANKYGALRYRGLRPGLADLELPDRVNVRARSYDGKAEVIVQGMAKPFVFERPPLDIPLRQWSAAVGSFGNLPQGKPGTMYVTEWKIRKLDEARVAQ